MGSMEPLLKGHLRVYLVSLPKHHYVHYGPHRYTEATLKLHSSNNTNTMTRFCSRLSTIPPQNGTRNDLRRSEIKTFF